MHTLSMTVMHSTRNMKPTRSGIVISLVELCERPQHDQYFALIRTDRDGKYFDTIGIVLSYAIFVRHILASHLIMEHQLRVQC